MNLRQCILMTVDLYGVGFTNFHTDERFMQDATFFKDASHLNDKGAIVFTNKIIKTLSQNEDTSSNYIM